MSLYRTRPILRRRKAGRPGGPSRLTRSPATGYTPVLTRAHVVGGAGHTQSER